MKQKIKSMVILVFVAFIAGIILCGNNVQASEVATSTLTKEELDEIVSKYPDTIFVDIEKETLEDRINSLYVPESYELESGLGGGMNGLTTSQRVQLKGAGIYSSSKNIKIIYTSNAIEKVKSQLPDTMKLDIPEAEYMKVTEIILSDIEQILKKENISYEYVNRYGSNVIKLKNITNNGKDIEISAYSGGTFFNNLYSATITINNTNYSKDIKVSYNNTQNHNSKDEQYVKNLKITNPVYYEIELGENLYEAIEKYHANAVKDKTITFSAEAAAGFGTALNSFIADGGVGLATFKNGIFYESKRIGYAFSIPVITVPSNIEDSKIENYVIDVVKKYINENRKTYEKKWAAEITKIEKGFNSSSEYSQNNYNVGIKDVYTVYSNATEEYYEENSFIIIRKDKNVLNTEKTTNIKLNTNIDVVPANTILECKQIKEEAVYNTVKTALKEISEKFIAYDITLKSNGIKIQPNGKVQISIPVPEGYDINKILVYRVTENEEKVRYDTMVEDNYIIFETDHFSTYVVAEEKTEEPSDDKGENEKDKMPQPETKVDKEDTSKTDTNSNEKDNTPKTGVIDITNYIIAIVLSSVLGIVTLKYKKQK